MGRGYAPAAALTLVGDHHQLHHRQRVAVGRSAAAPQAATARRAATIGLDTTPLVLDGFNVLITIEAALSGAVILRGADGRLRDLSSVHGTYRSVEETEAALHLLVEALAGAGEVRVVLDRPVSNSGRLADRMRQLGLRAELSDQADGALLLAATQGALLVSADGPLLDRAVAAGARLADPLGPRLRALPGIWCVDLGGMLQDATGAL